MPDTRFSSKADETQGYTDSHDVKHFYNALKTVYGPQSYGFSPLSADGTQLLTEKQLILERWAGHFDQVLNHPSAISDEAIARLPQVEINQELDNIPQKKKSERPSNNFPVAKRQDQMQFLLKCTKQTVQL
ncbi:hypothetical protein ACOMHN_014850 [Nucella lapillus]